MGKHFFRGLESNEKYMGEEKTDVLETEPLMEAVIYLYLQGHSIIPGVKKHTY